MNPVQPTAEQALSRPAPAEAPPEPPLPAAPRTLAMRILLSLVAAVATCARLMWSQRAVLAIWAAFVAFGWWLAVELDLVVLDALSRSAHAGFVWHNGPPKLAGLGFAWPPMATLPMLPFAAIPWLAATGMAGVCVSALATALLCVLVYRELVRIGLARWGAAAAAALLGIHPMVAYYGANGMSEAVSLYLVTLVVVGVLRWLDTDRIGHIVVASFAAAMAVMTRYELGTLSVVVAIGVAILATQGERTLRAGRAMAIFIMTPTIYAVVVWMYFNWTIQGSPFWFLTSGYQLATVDGSAETVGHDDVLAGFDRMEALEQVALAVFSLAPGLVLAIALCAYAIVRGRRGSMLVGALVVGNVVTMLVLAGIAVNPWMAQLRFNMRTIPIVLVVVAWLLRPGESARNRRLATAAVLACAVVAIPTSAWRMHTAPIQFTEHSFLEAMRTRDVMTGTTDVGGQTIGCQPARAMAQKIRALKPQRNSILADDSAMYAVMTYTGRPDWFIDRVDKGEAYFVDMVNRPARRIRYVLISGGPYCVGVTSELVTDRWPELYESGNDGYLDLVAEEGGFRLYEFPNSRRFEPPRQLRSDQ